MDTNTVLLIFGFISLLLVSGLIGMAMRQTNNWKKEYQQGQLEHRLKYGQGVLTTGEIETYRIRLRNTKSLSNRGKVLKELDRRIQENRRS